MENKIVISTDKPYVDGRFKEPYIITFEENQFSMEYAPKAVFFRKGVFKIQYNNILKIEYGFDGKWRTLEFYFKDPNIEHPISNMASAGPTLGGLIGGIMSVNRQFKANKKKYGESRPKVLVFFETTDIMKPLKEVFIEIGKTHGFEVIKSTRFTQ